MKELTKFFLVLIFTLALVSLPVYSQSKENGAIEGKVYSGTQPLPGVEITVSSPKLIGGTRVTVSNAEGRYRVVALPYGIYSIEAKLEGFTTVKKTGIKVTVGKTLSVDFSMTLGKITETVEVRGSALIDVKDSQTAVATLSKELIENMPNSQTVSEIVNLAPGVTGHSAFGSHDYGVQYQIDGVDVSDPGLGSAWVFLDYGTVEEAQIMGIGAPAEYGGFTGVVFNTVTKTGSNKFKGMVDAWMQLNKWNADNSGDTGVTPPSQGFYNASINLGGPFVKDKLWFFGAGQYKRRIRDITGFPEQSVYRMPRTFFKLTWQPNEDNRFNGFFHWELYEGTNRWADAFTDVEAAATQDGPGIAFNASYLHIFSDVTFFEAKFAGFKGFYKLRPKESYDIPGYYDWHSGRYTVNCIWYMHFYRTHLQANTSLSHHADDFIAGSHDFKFGIEAEYNPSTDEYGYSGGRNYYTYYYGYNYYMYEYEGYSTQSKSMRLSAYFQDSWEISDRLKINPGVRINYYRGKLEGVGTIFKPKIAIAPRIGITFDIFGDHTTALKAHYGKYYENIVSAKYTGLSEKPDHNAYLWGPIYNAWYGGNYGEEWVYSYSWNNGADTTSMDDNLSMPFMHQYSIGLERELFRDLSVGVSFIHRSTRNFIDSVLINGTFEPFTFTDEETGRQYTLYRQTNDPSENLYILTNVHKDKYPIISFEPQRKYSGLEFMINKKFSNKWTLLATYIYSKSTGNIDNLWNGRGSNSTGSSSMFKDPNNQINAEGRLSIDPEHMIKIQGSVILPMDITVGFYLLHQSGNTYNRRIRIPSDLLTPGQSANVSRLLADEAGSRYRYPSLTRLDLRIQKDFKFGNFRVGLLADIFNVFNAGTITDVNDTAEQFNEIQDIMYPRRFRLGLRLYL
jgi:outer membrane receptor protein involved in Fe transport